ISGVSRADTTNANPANAAITLPASLAVPLGSLDATKPGFRMRSYQTPQENPTQVAFYEEQLQGMHGRNVAEQAATNGTGLVTWADGVSPSGGPGALDLRSSYTGSSGNTLGGGAGGKFAYDLYGASDFSPFGIGALSGNSWPDNLRFSGANRAEDSC